MRGYIQALVICDNFVSNECWSLLECVTANFPRLFLNVFTNISFFVDVIFYCFVKKLWRILCRFLVIFFFLFFSFVQIYKNCLIFVSTCVPYRNNPYKNLILCLLDLLFKS